MAVMGRGGGGRVVSNFEERFVHLFHQDLPPPIPRTVYGPSSDVNDKEAAPRPPSRKRREAPLPPQQPHLKPQQSPPPKQRQQQQEQQQHHHHHHQHYEGNSTLLNLASDLIPMLAGPASSTVSRHLSVYASSFTSTSTTRDESVRGVRMSKTTREESVKGDRRGVKVNKTFKYNHSVKTREKRTRPSEGKQTRPISAPPGAYKGYPNVCDPGPTASTNLENIREHRGVSEEHVYEEVDYDWINNNDPSVKECDERNGKVPPKSHRKSSLGNSHPDKGMQCGIKTADVNAQVQEVRMARKKNPPQKPPRKSQGGRKVVSVESEQRFCENENNYNSDVVILDEIKGCEKPKSRNKTHSLSNTQSRPTNQNISDRPVRPERVKTRAMSQTCEESTIEKRNTLAKYYFGEGPGRRESLCGVTSERRSSHSGTNSLRRHNSCTARRDSTKQGKEGTSGNSTRRKKEGNAPLEQNSGQTPRKERKSSCKSRPSLKLSVRSKVSGGRTPNTPQRNGSGSSQSRRQSLKTSTASTVSEVPNSSQTLASPPPFPALHHDHQASSSSTLEHYHFSLPRVVLSGESNLAECQVSSHAVPRGTETWPRESRTSPPSKTKDNNVVDDDVSGMVSTDAPQLLSLNNRSSLSGRISPSGRHLSGSGSVSSSGRVSPSDGVNPGQLSPCGLLSSSSGQGSHGRGTTSASNSTSPTPHSSTSPTPHSSTSSRVLVASSHVHSSAGSCPIPSASLLQKRLRREVVVVVSDSDDDVVVLSHTNTPSLSHTTHTNTPSLSHTTHTNTPSLAHHTHQYVSSPSH
ncbi:hypothetical protein Pmani_029328 [Petrolisthes manimaculis]|uniref:Uncharacterized protein n=1 Tax=Petrolisthes manimaculis TaxID=1843537 RepID=A0AAE1NY91_9EUCA|nr:hypothetical protein Pmani_029328 [Petrolisthes manimaculis]